MYAEAKAPLTLAVRTATPPENGHVSQSQIQVPIISQVPTGKWYCTKRGCRKLNFPPSIICSKCGMAWPQPKPSPSEELRRIVRDDVKPISSILPTPESGRDPGLGRGRAVLQRAKQYEIGLNGKPRMRPALPLIPNHATKVTVSWIESMSEFYVVRVEDMPDLVKIEEGTARAGEWPDLKDPAVGDSCLCFAEDYCGWYRARILAIGKTSYKIHFADFGNKNLRYKGALKCLPLEWMNYPELAKKVSVKITDAFNKSSEKAVALFKTLTSGKVCQFTASDYDQEQSCYFGSLAVDGISDITPALEDANATISLSTPTSSLAPESESDSQVSGTTDSSGEYECTAAPHSEYTFTINKLQRPVLEPGDNREFSISSAVDFYHFYVRCDDRDTKQRLFQLMDTVNEHMLESKSKGKHNTSVDPVVGEVYIVAQIVAKEPNYFRGVVENVTKERYCQMRNVDNGESYFARLSDLTRISEEIFQIPALGYQVKLSGFNNTPNLIFKDDFDKFIRTLKSQKEVFKIDVDRVIRTRRQRTVAEVIDSIAVATLKFKGGGLLVTKILELRKWPWEHLYDMGARTDDEIILKETDEHELDPDIVDLDVPLEIDFEAVVRGVVPRDEKKKLPQIVFEPITKYTTDLKEVFANQVKNYMQKINASEYFPGFGDMAFVLPPEGFTGAGEWQRCLRASVGDIDNIDTLYCLDTYAVYPTKATTGFTYRKVIPDFMRIPVHVATGELNDPNYDIFTANCMLKTFVVGNKVTVKFLKKDDVNLFTFDSCDLKERMREEVENSDLEIVQRKKVVGPQETQAQDGSWD